MSSPRTLAVALAAVLLLPISANAQFLDKLKKKVNEAKTAVSDGRSVRCEVQGVCGSVRRSELFDPSRFESLAVTVLDNTARYGEQSAAGMARDAFESRLIANGFMLAADADAEKVRARMARGASMSDAELAELKDFVENIDAIIVVDIHRFDIGQCMNGGQPGQEATAHISARWLNADAGDVQWVATHKATACGAAADPKLIATVIETAAKQLAKALPGREKGM